MFVVFCCGGFCVVVFLFVLRLSILYLGSEKVGLVCVLVCVVVFVFCVLSFCSVFLFCVCLFLFGGEGVVLGVFFLPPLQKYLIIYKMYFCFFLPPLQKLSNSEKYVRTCEAKCLVFCVHNVRFSYE